MYCSVLLNNLILMMTSIRLVANLLFLSSFHGGAITTTASAAQQKGLPTLRHLQTTNNDNNNDEIYLPIEDSLTSWLFGAGDSSEWGDEAATTTHYRPTLIKIPALDQGEFVTDTSAGTLLTAVVTTQGRILTAGSVTNQDTGIGRDGTQFDSFQPITEVYYLDKNDNNKGDTYSKNPSAPPTFSKVVASQYYTLALDTNGNVWSTGSNTHGQLCLGDTTSRDRFFQVDIATTEGSSSSANNDAAPSGAKVVDIALGERHTLLLMDDGRVFGCGWNAYGQLGIGLKGDDMFSPVEIVIDEPDDISTTTDTPITANITQIAAGRGSSYFLTSSNHVYATGTNYEGQLCLGDRADETLPTLLLPVQDMLSNQGNDFSFIDEGVHVQLIAAAKLSFYMLFSDGRVVACGDNTHGELGNGGLSSTTAAANSSDIPVVITALTSVIDIFASAISFTVFFLQRNGIYGIGSDGSGQLGDGVQLHWDNPLSEVSCPESKSGDEVTGVQKNIIISSGNDHTLFLVNTDRIFDCNSTNKTSSMSPTGSLTTYYPTTNVSHAPSPSPFQSSSDATKSPSSGGVTGNGMGVVFCFGIAFATWHLT